MILSIDYRTDIPAFYSEWIMNRFREGFLMFRNPTAKNVVHKVILDKEHIEGIIWCSKNYALLLPQLSEITDKFPSVFQYTITGYGTDIEPNVPDILQTIDTFEKMSDMYGKDHIVWRYDPICYFNHNGNLDDNFKYHIDSFTKLCSELSGYTERVIINFVSMYEKVKKNCGELLIEIPYEHKAAIVHEFVNIAKYYGMIIQTCGNGLQFKDLDGVEVTGCIDEHALNIMGIYPKKNNKPKQWGCLCYPNTSVGSYNTCMHKCKYCYASADFDICQHNYEMHNPKSPLLIGQLFPDDIVKEMAAKPINTLQSKQLF